MNELEQEYAGKIDFIKVDIATTDGYCEFMEWNFSHTPSMIYRDSQGNLIETTDTFTEKEIIKQKLDDLLAR